MKRLFPRFEFMFVCIVLGCSLIACTFFVFLAHQQAQEAAVDTFDSIIFVMKQVPTIFILAVCYLGICGIQKIADRFLARLCPFA